MTMAAANLSEAVGALAAPGSNARSIQVANYGRSPLVLMSGHVGGKEKGASHEISNHATHGSKPNVKAHPALKAAMNYTPGSGFTG